MASYLETRPLASTLSGALGRRMEVESALHASGDLLAALPLIEDDAPANCPLRFNEPVIATPGGR